jgi:hypothetical protein
MFHHTVFDSDIFFYDSISFAHMLLLSRCHIFVASNCMEANLQRWCLAALYKQRDKQYAIYLPFFSC